MPLLFLESHGKAVLVKGDTRDVKDFLKEKGGKWNKGLLGWIFPGSKRAQLLEDLKGHGSTVEDRTGGGGADAAAAPPRPADAKAAPAASAPAAQKRTAPSSEVIVEISDKFRGTISSFNGSVGVDLRRFWADRESGEMRPTAKGVRLQSAEWQALLGLVPEIESLRQAAGAEASVKLGEDIVVRVGEGGKSVDVRRFYIDRGDGEQKPTKKGIFMSPTEWSNLRSSADEISAALRGEAADPAAQPPAQRKAKTDTAPKPAQSKADVVATSPAPEPGSTAHLRERLVKLLQGRDLQTVSLKSMRAELESSLSLEKGALDGRKEEIKGIITDLLKRGVP